MAELLKVYPKDITLMIEFRLAELDSLLDYLDRAEVVYDSEVEPEFKVKSDAAIELIRSLNEMCDNVRNYGHGS